MRTELVKLGEGDNRELTSKNGLFGQNVVENGSLHDASSGRTGPETRIE